MKKHLLLLTLICALAIQAQQQQIKKYINEGSWQLLSGYFATDSVYQNFYKDLSKSYYKDNAIHKSIPFWCISQTNNQYMLVKLGSITSAAIVNFTFSELKGKNVITSYQLQNMRSSTANVRLASNAPNVSTLLGYYHLPCKRFDDIKYYDDYREYYNNARNTPYLPSVNFQQIDFDPLKFEFNYCKKVLGFNVCGTKTEVLRPGPVLSDKDDARNKNANDYPMHYFYQISDMTAYAEPTNSQHFNATDKAYQLMAVITDETLKKVIFFRDGSEPVYYGNATGEYAFVQPIAVKELNGFVYVLDKVTESERNVIVLKPTYNYVPNSDQGGYSIQNMGNFNGANLGEDAWHLDNSTDIGGYKKLDGSSFLAMPGFGSLLHFEVNPTTGMPVANTTKRYKYMYKSINENGFKALNSDIIRLD